MRGAHEGGALAGLHVLELDDLERLAVDLDLQALAELGRIDDTGHGRSSDGLDSKAAVSSRQPPVGRGSASRRRLDCLQLGSCDLRRGHAQHVAALAVVAVRLAGRAPGSTPGDTRRISVITFSVLTLTSLTVPVFRTSAAFLSWREQVGVLDPGGWSARARARLVLLVGLHGDAVEAHHAAGEGSVDLVRPPTSRCVRKDMGLLREPGRQGSRLPRSRCTPRTRAATCRCSRPHGPFGAIRASRASADRVDDADGEGHLVGLQACSDASSPRMPTDAAASTGSRSQPGPSSLHRDGLCRKQRRAPRCSRPRVGLGRTECMGIGSRAGWRDGRVHAEGEVPCDPSEVMEHVRHRCHVVHRGLDGRSSRLDPEKSQSALVHGSQVEAPPSQTYLSS